ncbi:MAG TPA: MerR family transcriptional regulator, partial [Kofleriaceae bacterium]|nr:MerR family transcriptional regulator [Kofleriaceae bacterium]
MARRPRRDRPAIELVRISDLARAAGVPVGTLKHYMRQGLLPEPQKKTSRNMAYYDARLADRVRVIKELQHEHFLPLRVIGELLEPAPSARLRPGAEVGRQA